jgi:hypothetical protein
MKDGESLTHEKLLRALRCLTQAETMPPDESDVGKSDVGEQSRVSSRNSEPQSIEPDYPEDRRSWMVGKFRLDSFTKRSPHSVKKDVRRTGH